MKPPDAKLHELASQLAGLQKRAKALGVFTNDRELLECPRCGLLEDVTSNARNRLCNNASPWVTLGNILYGQEPNVGYSLTSIPAKPLVQITLKCGGFFIAPIRS
jgi:hypothetical protein